jgi:hypothetical protein
MAQNFNSYKDKIVDFGFRDGSFKNDSGENVDYKQLILKLNIDGDIEELVLSGANAPKPTLLNTILKGANVANPDGGFLDDNGK